MYFHISNLGSNIIETDLFKMFSRFGEVDKVRLVRDKLNNRARGRAFVELPMPVTLRQLCINFGAKAKKSVLLKRNISMLPKHGSVMRELIRVDN